MDIDAPPTPPQIPPLESGSIIEQASRGEKIEDWNAAQDVFRQRLDTILTTWEAPDSAMYLDQLSSFLAPPHTVQRLAELLIEPYTWYHDSAKYTRALIRILSVTSTTVDFSEEKEVSSLSHEDSSLVPIPWLARSSIDELEMTTMPSRNIPHTTDGLQPGNSGPSGASLLSGSAPMDATDYGPQCEAVQETIASNAAAHDAESSRNHKDT